MNILGRYVWDEETCEAADLVNELNDVSPDVILSKLPNVTQQKLICENRRMINASVWIALLYERVVNKKKKVTFGSGLDRIFYKRLFKRKVDKYENEKAESEKPENKDAETKVIEPDTADAQKSEQPITEAKSDVVVTDMNDGKVTE